MFPRLLLLAWAWVAARPAKNLAMPTAFRLCLHRTLRPSGNYVLPSSYIHCPGRLLAVTCSYPPVYTTHYEL